MEFVHLLVIVSAGISIFGATAYIRDTLAGKTKPNRVSWSMWALAPLIGTGAALAGGADPWATLRIFLAGFLPLLIFLTSFANRQSYWKLSSADILCGLCSLAAIATWIITDNPRLAILLAAIADGFALIPTLIKAWHFPETETGTTYLASLIATLLVIPSIPAWTIENTAFQIYLIIANTALIIAVYRLRFFPRKNSSIQERV